MAQDSPLMEGKRLLAIGRASSPCPHCGSYLAGTNEQGTVYCLLCLHVPPQPIPEDDLDMQESVQDVVEGRNV